MSNVVEPIAAVRGAAAQSSRALEAVSEPLEQVLLEAEARFYRTYAWCLNAFPTVREMTEHLRREVRAVDETDGGWQRAEAVTNVFLLSCAITDTVDDYLLGTCYDFSKATMVIPPLGPLLRGAEALLRAHQRAREGRLGALHHWRDEWGAGVEAFLRVGVAEGRADRDALSRMGAKLTALLDSGLPDEVQRRRPRIPAPFRTRDLTPMDILALGRKFAAAFPTRERPVLVVGLRTAGSYFAPLLCASLAAAGYRDLQSVTIRPKKVLSRREAETLARNAHRGALAVIVDEPPVTGATLAKGVDLIRKAGFAAADVIALLPIHQAWCDWATRPEALPLSEIRVVSLLPEQWHKRQMLKPEAIEDRLAEYFAPRNRSHIRVVTSPTAERLNLARQDSDARLKRIYEVRLDDGGGQTETRFILAKSVGWGWLGYHAVLIGERLSRFVPPLLGLRDGFLYTEWLPQDPSTITSQDRGRWLETVATYVAARVRHLNLSNDPAPDLGRADQHRGFEVLASTLARAHGWKATGALKRTRLKRELMHQTCPVPTLIDGKMRPQEWIAGPQSLLKTDFEHHGQGKHELNVTDPAYDLAEAILYLGLSDAEEGWLLNRYIERSEDTGVQQRLFLNKLLAGTWALQTALANLADATAMDRAREFNQRYLDAWNFLVTHTVRLCGRVVERPATLRWHSPVVVLDIDGVLDKGVIGFPSTSAAGLRALSLLHAHDIAIALNTARTLSEVKEYCRAYGFVGGVAEYGSTAWDALSGQERILVTPDALRQLDSVRTALQLVPGVFLNDNYRYSIRAYTFERGTTVPLPTLLIRELLAGLSAVRLDFLQTHSDTAIVAKEVDKGKGLLALLEMVDQRDSETIAIGDSDPDLAMFRVAHLSYAPSHISHRSVARLLGCHIASHSYQAGLLQSVQSFLHPDGGRCDCCRRASRLRVAEVGPLVWELLEAADRGPLRLLLRALLDPMALRAFAR
jgi:hydroxymethylpyrimidine pyrophosphatase-like HAD family hydrolase/adenine/guanine phosphoribosyltransferase-like PRPP-binding protein